MKTMLFAAAAALNLGIGSAYAADGPAGGYVHPDYIFPGSVYAGAVQNDPSVATVQNGRAAHIYGTHSQSQSQGIWLFPPNQVGGNG
jgi:hypothetical protein